MKELAYQSAANLAPFIQSKQLSPVELTEVFLDRMTKYDKTINSYITPLPEMALTQAKQAEHEIMQGDYKGPLHGIPLGIKDNIETKGIRTTAGSKILANYIPEKTATSIQNLTNAGSIILGKQNTHEFAAGTTNINPFYGSARNPWNTGHMTGGSSGGSAAALAAGLTTIAQGTDTIGSIRIPSSMCGTYGLKPTYGLVSNNGGIPTAWSMDVQGPMARSTADLALMLHYTARYDKQDPASLNVASTDYMSQLNKGLAGVKIGVPTYYQENLDADVEKLFKKSIASLQHLGAQIKEIEIPELKVSTFTGMVTMSGEASGYHYEWLQTRAKDYGQDIRSFLETGVLSSTAQYMKAQQARRMLIKAFQKAFREVDILLGPSIPITAPAFQENWVKQNLEVEARVVPFTAPANITGIPSLSVPMGRCSKGLPAGMQLMGNFLSEKQLLQAAYAWEQTNPLLVNV